MSPKKADLEEQCLFLGGLLALELPGTFFIIDVIRRLKCAVVGLRDAQGGHSPVGDLVVGNLGLTMM